MEEGFRIQARRSKRGKKGNTSLTNVRSHEKRLRPPLNILQFALMGEVKGRKSGKPWPLSGGGGETEKQGRVWRAGTAWSVVVSAEKKT